MTLTANTLPAGFHKDVLKAANALENRLKKQGDRRVKTSWSFHRGIPYEGNVPTDGNHVWLAPTDVARDPEFSTLGYHSLDVTWSIAFIMEDPGSDEHGFDFYTLVQAASELVEVLMTKRTDQDLDDSVEFTDGFRWRLSFGLPPSSIKRLGIGTTTFTTKMQGILMDC